MQIPLGQSEVEAKRYTVSAVRRKSRGGGGGKLLLGFFCGLDPLQLQD